MSELMVYALFGLLFWGIIGGLIGSSINRTKGLDSLTGFFVGGFLGIFALLLFFQKDNKKAMGLKKCPSCAEWVKREALVCKFCQKEMPPATPMKA